jgi:hypothetical protein
MANTTNVAIISTANTFNHWRIRDNLVANDVNEIARGDFIKPKGNVTVNEGTLTLANTSGGVLLTVKDDARIDGLLSVDSIQTDQDGYVYINGGDITMGNRAAGGLFQANINTKFDSAYVSFSNATAGLININTRNLLVNTSNALFQNNSPGATLNVAVYETNFFGTNVNISNTTSGSLNVDNRLVRISSPNVSITNTHSSALFSVTPNSSFAGNVTISGTANIASNVLVTGTTVYIGGSGVGRVVVRGFGTTNSTHSFEATTNAGATRYLVSDDGLSRWYGNTNAETMRIESNGNLGIGNAVPTARVDAQRNSYGIVGAFRAYDGTGNPRFIVYGTANGTTLQHTFSTGAANLMFAIGGSEGAGTEVARFDGNGNFGVGTTSPVAKIDVRSGFISSGTTTSTNGSRVLAGYYDSGYISTWGTEFSTGGTVLGYGVWPSTSNSGAFLSSSDISLTRAAYTLSGFRHIWYTGASQTVTTGNPVTMSERMRLDENGNLGIGTASPTFGSGSGVEIERAGIATLRLENSSASNSFELYADSAANGINLRGRDSSPMLFWTGNTERMRLDNTGNLGIGVAPAAWRSGATALQIG